jgi:hypothetical protein
MEEKLRIRRRKKEVITLQKDEKRKKTLYDHENQKKEKTL